jgi:hypothetical protein
MKNTIKLFGIIAIVAIIGLTMAACGDQTPDDEEFAATTAGQLTITGLSAHDGKTILATGSAGGIQLAAGARASNTYYPGNDWSGVKGDDTNGVYPATISGGTVTLKVFKDNGNEKKGKTGGWQSYTGNDQNVQFAVSINGTYSGGGVTVNFANGIGVGAFVPPID